MEVHHHAHTSRKKWTHYFWEFLMLFLAVFCGFLAEYQLEHKIEKDREKQYANSLYEDLKIDTAILKESMRINDFVTRKIDTFRNMVQHQTLQSLPAGTWYYYGRFGTRYMQVAFQDATLHQLKSSGGLRYFKNRNVADAIARYDQSCRRLQTQLDFQDPVYELLLSTRNKIFNSYFLDEVMDLDLPAGKIDSFKQKTMPFLSEDKQDFIQYANICQIRSNNNKNLWDRKAETLKKGEELIAILKNKYRLK
ncbi:MAG: hypothetical protein IPN56_14515 [Chitinophagaceae bacterium]|nr:hypothetical protein [Chitinophagaceae bacterium]